MCHEAQSLHLRYGLDIALSTLNSCRHLHESKTRFPVGRLIPFPGRESHPLKAPGLPWRTEVGSQIKINDACLPFHDRFVHSENRFLSCPLRSVSVRPRLEVSFEDRLQDELERTLDHTVTNGRNRKHADLGSPVFRNLLFSYPHGLIRVVDQFVLNLFQKTSLPLSSMASNVTPLTSRAPSLFFGIP